MARGPHRRERRGTVRDRALERAVDDPAHLDAEPGVGAEAVGEGREEIVLDPLAHELVARAKARARRR